MIAQLVPHGAEQDAPSVHVWLCKATRETGDLFSIRIVWNSMVFLYVGGTVSAALLVPFSSSSAV